MMKFFNVVVSLAFLLLMFPQSSSAGASLKVGFYKKSCPKAELVVKESVARAVAKNPGIAAGLIRLHFHDCFVTGCDASLLLESRPGGKRSEQEHPANGQSLRGFEVINEAKTKLETLCPNTVSCADILAFAARDGSKLVGGISYRVPGGRRDGRVSLESQVGNDNLPPPVEDVGFLAGFFTRKGMSVTQMVALSGAHSIGVSQCGSFSNRLYSFNDTMKQDPSLDPKFASFLKSMCPNNSGGGSAAAAGVINLDVVTPNRLDHQYFKNLNKKRGLLSSDQALATSSLTADAVAKYVNNPKSWAADYAAAMLQMGSIDVLTGKQGEIRKICRSVN